jgi:hypothetical protein
MGGDWKRGPMRAFAVCVGVALTGFVIALAVPASAQTTTNPPKQPRKIVQVQPVVPVQRSAAGTVIQPTRTIIHNPDGTTTIITVPRRSYLEVGNEVPVGYPRTNDYAFPPNGDPGRPYWYFGPDVAGIGGSPLAQPDLIPGFGASYPVPY